ncbi:NAD(+) diphosphatase [Celeribacter neptunius]|uniref:NAD(+) diphosphatase n=1 Tax=Celeribacter neptunius TaxID=588602 RepID=A0A1I3UUB6_9RHOB|nr:NAD(+) diphosphatase [Celeribacter neptunius]SFJ85431.1 NAD+ diphosphatase [Celeribacter neptunius]
MKQDGVALAGGELNRAAHLRREAEALRSRDGMRLLALWRGSVPLDERGHFALFDAGDLPAVAGDEIFLGLLTDGAPVFAVDVSHLAARDPQSESGNPWSQDGVTVAGLESVSFFDLRAVMTRLSPLEAELAGTARGVFEWHRQHGFCAACGARTVIADAGWRRDCPACGASHFPRTDPVVIMLVTHGNSVLLGRNANWPERMYSLLAGFVEPGEPIEAAVRREVFEEAGVRIGTVRYVTSQPWPFPASLMFGCTANALSTEIEIDPEEISDARWVSREELALAVAGRHPEIAPPRKGAVAQFLLTKWLADR